MNIVWVDIVIPAVIIVSVLFGILRGFVREAFSLSGWLLAFWVGLSFAAPLAGRFLQVITAPSVRMVVAFTLLFVVTLVLAALVTRLMGHLVQRSGLTGTDRMVGMVFGAVRGIVIVAVLVLLGGMTTLPKDTWWRDSQLIGGFEKLAIWLRDNVVSDNGA